MVNGRLRGDSYEDNKWDIRHKVWDYIENKNLANFPRPVHNRIPNFKGALEACSVLSNLEAFTKTTAVKVDPDKPLEGVRLAALQARKTLLVPTPRLKTGLFNKIVPPKGATKQVLHVCSTSQGIKEFGVPVGLEDSVQVNLVVIGSVAVSENGYRIGKGEGFADMEYAMMACMGAVCDSTVIVTIVHDCQVMDIPEKLIEDHDLTVDFILTPTRIIQTECKRPKPQGIIWSKLDTEVLTKIPILKKLRLLEQTAGKDVTLKTPPAGEYENNNLQEACQSKIQPELKCEPNCDPKSKQQYGHLTYEDDKHARFKDKFHICPSSTIYLGDIPARLRVSELKNLLKEQEAVPLRINWQGAQHRAFLRYADSARAEHALQVLKTSLLFPTCNANLYYAQINV
ncbi:Methenyltetrahydrofolate synthase domain-containing protein [Triplophysa tibetana]|uniref:Methenyltetrahydrofolate synthase domain-containing protein n=1 Tax=Triplophysa tibetana TaxID=1572043 RepID=A0A5A9P1N8_9TELE|nr:Methenyltetrahydrofolate synthase domain-containing protein [Triplophysa tibetana]